MKLQIITLYSIFLLCINKCQAQDMSQAAPRLLKLEQSYFAANSKEERSNISFQKLGVYAQYHLERDEECLSELFRINADHLSPTDKSLFHWNAGLIYMRHENYAKAVDHLLSYQAISEDTSLTFQLMITLANSLNPYPEILNIPLNEEVKSIAICLQKESTDLRSLDTKLNLYSYLIPGSGMVLKGYPVKGAVSFGLNALGVLFSYSLFHNRLYMNGIGYSLLTTLKFYQGNNSYTHKLVRRKTFKRQEMMMTACHQQLTNLLNAYPPLLKN